MDTILVLDFGGQTAQLICRRIRECGVFSRIAPGDVPLTAPGVMDGVKGVVLSGSPYSVHDADAPRPDPGLLAAGVPLLGICYGMQHLMHGAGARVSNTHVREYGRAQVEQTGDSALFAEIPGRFSSWMSHGDAVADVPAGYREIARSAHGALAAVESVPGELPVSAYGIQFHPEVSHTEHGRQLLANFATGICGAEAGWTIESFERRKIAELRRHVGDRPVVLMISGGVDSTVVAALLIQALPANQVHLLYVDTGLMRLGESDEVRATLARLGASQVEVVDAADRFLGALGGVTEPEAKRRIIGDLFIDVQDEVIGKDIADGFLAQGTLYTDLIESGSGVGDKAQVIKTHHNVASPLVAARRRAGLVIEPLAELYKDEVRALGAALGLPDSVVRRHPFPGPGLAVRILGEVTAERCALLRRVDAIFIDELVRRQLYHEVTQALAVLLPINSVGVAGDSRHYGAVVALRAVVTDDFMTADVYGFEPQVLQAISSRITNEVPEIGRVVYDISSKPPATVEWE